MHNSSYVVATIKSWNIEQFEKNRHILPGTWHIVTHKKDLSLEVLKRINPRYIFFPHWSWIVPDTILNRWECVCFHMTDVPYGRGGSPLQNLIIRGHTITKLTALRMTKELDAGPVYAKTDLTLDGNAQEIYYRASEKIYDLVRYIINEEPEPQEQLGPVTHFTRRTPDQSEIPDTIDVAGMYNYIRMLDAESYPKAFLMYGKLKIEFANATLSPHGEISAEARISKA